MHKWLILNDVVFILFVSKNITIMTTSSHSFLKHSQKGIRDSETLTILRTIFIIILLDAFYAQS